MGSDGGGGSQRSTLEYVMRPKIERAVPCQRLCRWRGLTVFLENSAMSHRFCLPRNHLMRAPTVQLPSGLEISSCSQVILLSSFYNLPPPPSSSKYPHTYVTYAVISKITHIPLFNSFVLFEYEYVIINKSMGLCYWIPELFRFN